MSVKAYIDARELDQRVRFDRAVTTQDATGDPVVTWTPIVEVFTKVDGARAFGAEPYVTNGIRSVADYTVWIRADIKERYGIVLTDRVVWKGKNFNIADMPDQQLRGRFLALVVRTGENDG